jgi:hypothetical protein
MMKNDSEQILDDLLERWHAWSRGYAITQQAGADPMFRNVKSGRGWDTVDEIVESELTGSTMKAIDFEVNEIPDPHRSAIHAHARNPCLRVAVWTSPRLPTDPAERQEIINDARMMLMRRLWRAGIM